INEVSTSFIHGYGAREMLKEIQVSSKEDEAGTRFYYIDLGSETHGRPSFRLWVSSRLVQTKKDSVYGFGDEIEIQVVRFPANAYIKKTEKGTLILKPSENHITHYIYVPCGYRGGSSIEILEPKDAETFKFYNYSSPRGSLGISVGMLVVIPKDKVLKFRWERSGRTYGDPKEGITIVLPDGTEKEIDMVADGIEELEELKKELYE
ncbi:MAG: hypothetical protein J7K82_08845, partial [Thermoproteales archaeon]|nr:hypothetical protein [Thermoproteales archaeon]